jgi:hypothetical protein
MLFYGSVYYMRGARSVSPTFVKVIYNPLPFVDDFPRHRYQFSIAHCFPYRAAMPQHYCALAFLKDFLNSILILILKK